MSLTLQRPFLLLRGDWEKERGDDGVRAELNSQRKSSWRSGQQKLQEFRVPESSAVFEPSWCKVDTSLPRLAILFCISEVLRSCLGTRFCWSFNEEVACSWVYWVQDLLSGFGRVLVFDSDTHSPQLASSAGHVAMEDSKLMHLSGPSQTLDQTDPDSKNNSEVLQGDNGIEKNKSENSPVLPSPDVEASSTGVQQPSSGAGSPSKREDESVGIEVCPPAFEGEATLEASKNEASESAGVDNISLDQVVRCDGETAVNNSAEPDGPPVEAAGDANTTANEGDGRRTSPATEATQNGKPEANIKANDGSTPEANTQLSEATTVPNPILTEVLEKLISLDPTEVFKDPVDDSFAPNYSKIIKAPMCFSTMQEKVELNHYSSWRLFLEDFERICNNAMKYNQKRSKIWNAASTLLRQGRKVIEPYLQSRDVSFGSADPGEIPPTLIEDAASMPQDSDEAHVQDSANDVTFESKGENHASKTEQDFAKSSHLDDASNQLSATKNGEKTGRKSSTDNIEVYERGMRSRPFVQDGKLKRKRVPGETDLGLGEDDEAEESDGSKRIVKKQTVSVIPDLRMTTARHRHNNAFDPKLFSNAHGRTGGYSERLRARNNMHEDVKVEILEVGSPEELRPDLKDDATESSSSFGYTKSTADSDLQAEPVGRSAEVESALRDGNGALSCPFAEDDELLGGNDSRGKKALNVDWKKYRRGIEWRCRWLEIRLKELKARSDRYERLLMEKKRKRSWIMDFEADGGYSTRSAGILDDGQNTEVVPRLPRKEVENTVDLDMYMGRHPLFSRYDKKRKGEMDDAYVEPKVEESQHVQNLKDEAEQRIAEESDTEEHLAMERPSVGGQDSMEQILWKVEALQARVEKAKFSLSKGAPAKLTAQSVTSSKLPTSLPRIPMQPSPRIQPSGHPGPGRPPGTKGRPPSGQSPGLSGTPTANGASQRQASASIRRKSSDYDINNMVMPVSVGTKYVEHIKHADIWTPHWRLVQDTAPADQSVDDSSSDEDTDDERVAMRHADMETHEKMQRCTLPPKRSPTGDTAGPGKGKSKPGIGKGAGKMSGRGSVPTSKVEAALTADSQDSSSSSAFARSIPKGKRRKRLFNATAFTSTHAQRLAAYLEESSGTFHGLKARESIVMEDVELKTSEDTSVDSIPPEIDESNTQLELSTDAEEPKPKRSGAVGLQVLANP